MMKEQRSGNPALAGCEEFQDRLAELFESEVDLGGEKHLQTCENCASLVRDLTYIAQQAKLLLPIHDPSPCVWEGIELALKKEGPRAK